MPEEYDYQNQKSLELDTSSLLDDISQFLITNKPGGEIQAIDGEVADELTPEEYLDYRRYKNYCMQELGTINQTPGVNGALNASIERGFVLGYWFGLKHFKEKVE